MRKPEDMSTEELRKKVTAIMYGRPITVPLTREQHALMDEYTSRVPLGRSKERTK